MVQAEALFLGKGYGCDAPPAYHRDMGSGTNRAPGPGYPRTGPRDGFLPCVLDSFLSHVTISTMILDSRSEALRLPGIAVSRDGGRDTPHNRDAASSVPVSPPLHQTASGKGALR